MESLDIYKKVIHKQIARQQQQSSRSIKRYEHMGHKNCDPCGPPLWSGRGGSYKKVPRRLSSHLQNLSALYICHTMLAYDTDVNSKALVTWPLQSRDVVLEASASARGGLEAAF